MKNVFKKNQVIITALAIMIAVAGYLNYSGTKFGTDESEQASSDKVENDSLDISDEDLYAQADGDITSNDVDLTSSTDDKEESDSEADSADGETKETSVDSSEAPGEAVLASSSQIVSKAKINREQVRAKSKETLLEIINNDKLTDAQKQDAVDSMIELTEIAEKEAAAETLLSAKGFSDAVVSISDGKADVVVDMADVTDAKRAQIEDIVKRKTGVEAENIVITPISEK